MAQQSFLPVLSSSRAVTREGVPAPLALGNGSTATSRGVYSDEFPQCCGGSEVVRLPEIGPLKGPIRENITFSLSKNTIPPKKSDGAVNISRSTASKPSPATVMGAKRGVVSPVATPLAGTLPPNCPPFGSHGCELLVDAVNNEVRQDLLDKFCSEADGVESGRVSHEKEDHRSSVSQRNLYMFSGGALSSPMTDTQSPSGMSFWRKTEPPLSPSSVANFHYLASRRGSVTLAAGPALSTQPRRPSMSMLKEGRRASVQSFVERMSQCGSASISNDIAPDNVALRRIVLRDVQKRRFKKDAPSIYSVEFPAFDEETGVLGDSLRFPSSLGVAEAISDVLRQERGEMQVKTSSVGIRQFLNTFPESHEIIFLYFWYIVAHARRVSAEQLLIDRYTHLENVFRAVFPCFKNDIPSVTSLQQISTNWLRAVSELKNKNSTVPLVNTEAWTLEEILDHQQSISDRKRDCLPMLGNAGFLNNAFKIPTSPSGCNGETSNAKRRSVMTQFQRSIGDMVGSSNLINTGCIDNKMMSLRLANAVDIFSIVNAEVCEHTLMAERCFDRLAILFGKAFERLSVDKDEVLSAFTTVVPHVVYYSLMHCFPNDFWAGLFNSTLRVNIYRIFYFWCSGLMVTYVRSNGWPVPHQYRTTLQKDMNRSVGESSSLEASTGPCTGQGEERNREQAESPELGTDGEMGPISVPRTNNDEQNTAKRTEEDSFDEIDVQMVNGHHRIVLEFKKYAKHVNYLVQELEMHTMELHDQVTESIAAGISVKVDDLKPPRGAKQGGEGTGKHPLGKVPRQPAVTGGTAANSNVRGKPLNSAVVDKTATFEIRDPSAIRKVKQHGAGAKPVQASANVAVDGATSKKISPTRNANAGAACSSNQVDVKNALVGNNGKNKKDCIICGFPMASVAERIRRYVAQHSAPHIVEVPLPHLDSVATQAQTGYLLTGVEEGMDIGTLLATFTAKHLKPRERTVRVPLPSSSPLFLHYARRHLHPSVSSALEEPASSTRALIVLRSARSEKASECTSETPKGSRRSQPPVPEDRMPHIAKGGLVSSQMKVGHINRKGINVLFIPPSEAKLRPLQFKGLMRELTKWQLAFDEQLAAARMREEALRQEYNHNAQGGLRLAQQFFSESRDNRAKTDCAKEVTKQRHKRQSRRLEHRRARK
ncbi:hypothetical protein TRVL_06923 [Trypanosoma vivax]|nr:hypothetical protein TRVL_06923 [Trypanosoma vivax]